MRSATLRAMTRRLAISLLRRANNGDPRRRDRNGETWLIGRVGPGARRIIDVGCNHGEYSRAFLDLFPEVEILAVEPVPAFFEHARAALPASVDLQNVALSDGVEELAIYRKGGGANASPRPPKNKAFARIEPTVTTGDALVEARGFGPAQFIKIDTDGYDLQALRGFARSIDAWRPVIQFEFSRFWLDTRSQLRDAFEFFEGRDYRIGYLTPRAVDFVTYDVRLEVYALSCNMVAAPTEKCGMF
jgi:FkbM family methyltransferase